MLKKSCAVILSFLIALSIFEVLAFAKADNSIGISAKSAVLIDASTGKILFAKNESSKMPMASTTKIMTALLTLESGGLDKEFTVDSSAIMVEGSSMGLKKNDIVTKRILAYGMMLPSGNDAANAGAVAVAGSIDKFVDMMNKKAAKLGLSNTSFETPSGLDGENHYSTALDMARLARFAISNTDFLKICSTRVAKLKYGNPPYTRYLSNHNRLLKEYKGAIGVKTGFTKKSGRCLVSAAERDGVTLIAVTLNAPSDWSDHNKLLNFGFKKVNKRNFTPDVSDIKLDVVGSDKESIEVIPADFPSVTFSEDYEGKLERRIITNKFLYAPVESGSIVGTVEYYYDGVKVAQTSLLAGSEAKEKLVDVKKHNQSKIIMFFKNIFYSVKNFFS